MPLTDHAPGREPLDVRWKTVFTAALLTLGAALTVALPRTATTASSPDPLPAAPLAHLDPKGPQHEAPVVLITGSTGGLGREVALALASTGAHVIVHGRDAVRGGEVVDQINQEGRGSARFFGADLASLDEVRAFAETLLAEYDRLDLLINNAGLGRGEPGSPRRLSADGHELLFQVNYLSGFLLTHLLLPRLIESAPAQIINVASGAQTPIDFDDVMMESGYDGSRAYGQSKLAQILFTFDLSHRLAGTGVSVNALHPASLMPTTMVLERGAEPVDSLEDGLRSVLHLAQASEPGTGQYFNRTEVARAHDQAYDEEARARLWQLSEEITGLR